MEGDVTLRLNPFKTSLNSSHSFLEKGTMLRLPEIRLSVYRKGEPINED